MQSGKKKNGKNYIFKKMKFCVFFYFSTICKFIEIILNIINIYLIK